MTAFLFLLIVGSYLGLLVWVLGLAKSCAQREQAWNDAWDEMVERKR